MASRSHQVQFRLLDLGEIPTLVVPPGWRFPVIDGEARHRSIEAALRSLEEATPPSPEGER